LPWMPWAADAPQPLQHSVDLLRSFRSKFDSDADYIYGVFSPDESEAYGGSGLHTRAGTDAREIGYWITKAQARQGYATETAGALTKVAFEVSKMQRMEIHVAAGNEASIAVARKLGYVHEATLRQRLHLYGGDVVDRLVFTLLANEYPHSPAAAQPIQAFDVNGRKLL
jgi:RimJ/RimL family protein N-acetyltransferase